MAVTQAGDYLTDAHRLLTGRIANEFRREIRSVTLRMLRDNQESWAREVTRITENYSDKFLATTRAYHALHRAAEGATRAMKVPEPKVFPKKKATSTAYAAGIAKARDLGVWTPGVTVSDARLNGLAVQLGAKLMLPAMEAARTYSRDFAVADPQAVGWARVGEGGECGFCADLIARGAVYSEHTVDFEAHPNCRCTSEVVYRGWRESPSSAIVRNTMADRDDSISPVDPSGKSLGGSLLGRVESVGAAEYLIKQKLAADSLTVSGAVDLGLSVRAMSEVPTRELTRWVDARVMKQEALLSAAHLAALRSGLETQILREMQERLAGKSLSPTEVAEARQVMLEILAARGM